MIDLLKNYKQLQNTPGYVGSLRYFLAKKKIDTLFLKWLSLNKDSVDQLLNKAQQNTLKANQQPSPLFSYHIPPFKNSAIMTVPYLNFNNTLSPPKSSQDLNCERHKKSNYSSPLLTQSAYLSKPVLCSPINDFQIPQFYFPKGKPVDELTRTTNKSLINTIFGDKQELSDQTIKKLVSELLGLPNYFSTFLIIRGTRNSQARTLKRTQFQEVWKELQCKDIYYRAFWLISSDKRKKFCFIQDFKILLNKILQVHPGLQFLKDTPDFQNYYALCVIHRMYFMANRKGDYKLTYRQFSNSNILKSLFDIENEPDINRNTDFFSYQDFYVIYMKFWQLDSDQDFFLQKQELSKYNSYTLSRKTVERIFSQCAKKFMQPNKMTFEDFVWFILAVQDKTTQQSIEYWFKILDLDGNGIVTGYELEYFYEEQNQRLAYMGSKIEFNFENIICQMVDLLKPRNSIQFTLQNFIVNRQDAGTYINILTDFNKLVKYEKRDVYEQRDLKQKYPLWTQWDKFVKPEYKRIQSQNNQDDDNIIDWDYDD